MAAQDQLSCVDKVLRDGPPTDEAGLVNVNKRLNLVLQPGGKDLGEYLHWAILQGYWAEVGRSSGASFLWQQHNEGPVYALEIDGASMKISEKFHDVPLHCVPSGLVKSWTDTVKSRRVVVIHSGHCLPGFFFRERCSQGLAL